VRRKVLIVKPNGMFSTIYTEGGVELSRAPTGAIVLTAGEAIWHFAHDTRFDFIELQGREE
jgi:hypothetical protein